MLSQKLVNLTLLNFNHLGFVIRSGSQVVNKFSKPSFSWVLAIVVECCSERVHERGVLTSAYLCCTSFTIIVQSLSAS